MPEPASPARRPGQAAGIWHLAACSTKMPDKAFGFSGMTSLFLALSAMPANCGRTARQVLQKFENGL
ncbi:MAG: hypothetical protein ACLPX9_06405 [Rhodomicrobium sp.]